MMLSSEKAKAYGLENISIERPEFDYEITVESLVNDIENSCDLLAVEHNISYEGVMVHLSSDQLERIKNFVVGIVKKIWEMIKKAYNAIKDFFAKIFRRDQKLDADLSKTQSNLKAVKGGLSEEGRAKLRADLKAQGIATESISLEDAAKSISIGNVDAIDLHDHYKGDVSIQDFDKLIAEFNKSTGSLNGYFQSIDSHIKMVSDVREDMIASNDPSRVESQIKNKPAVPSTMRSREFDFFRVGKIGVPDHFEQGEGEGLKSLSDTFKKNVPRLIKNVNIDPLNLVIDKGADIVTLADKWHGDLETIKSANKLSGQYLKMALVVLDEKQKHFTDIDSKIVEVVKKDGGNKDSLAKFQAYAEAVKAQINYIHMYINVMTYYHNATAKIADSINKVINRLLDFYLMSF